MVMNWVKNISEKFGAKKKFPIEETLVALIQSNDPRMVIRPLGNDWLCPYTGSILETPNWNGALETLLDVPGIFEYLSNLPALQDEGLAAPMRSWNELLETTIKLRLKDSLSFKVSTEKGYWICPYCRNVSDVLLVQWDATPAPLEWVIPAALAHLKGCMEYAKHPLTYGSPEEVINSLGQKGIRMELLKRVQYDPVFRVTDDLGNWICPFTQRAIESLNTMHQPWGDALNQKIVEYMMTPACPGRYSQWKPECSVAELQRAAGKISANRAHTGTKMAVEEELNRLRQRVGELSQRVSTVEELEQDLAAARKVQLKMLPQSTPKIPGYEIGAFYQPCVQLGGDLYNFLEVGPGGLGLLVGDVSGHGVSAAVIMAMAQKAFSMRAPGNFCPASVARQVNADMAKDMPRGKFVSAFYGVLAIETGTLQFSRAGHPPPLLLMPDQRILPLEAGGLALGIGSPEVFDKKLQKAEVQLPPGATLLIYTDGIPEAMNAEKEEFTDEKLCEAFAECAGLSVQETILYLLSAVREHAGSMRMQDDLTLVVVKRGIE